MEAAWVAAEEASALPQQVEPEAEAWPQVEALAAVEVAASPLEALLELLPRVEEVAASEEVVVQPLEAAVKSPPEEAAVLLVEQVEQSVAYLPHYFLCLEFPDPPRLAEVSC